MAPRTSTTATSTRSTTAKAATKGKAKAATGDVKKTSPTGTRSFKFAQNDQEILLKQILPVFSEVLRRANIGATFRELKGKTTTALRDNAGYDKLSKPMQKRVDEASENILPALIKTTEALAKVVGINASEARAKASTKASGEKRPVSGRKMWEKDFADAHRDAKTKKPTLPELSDVKKRSKFLKEKWESLTEKVRATWEAKYQKAIEAWNAAHPELAKKTSPKKSAGSPGKKANGVPTHYNMFCKQFRANWLAFDDKKASIATVGAAWRFGKGESKTTDEVFSDDWQETIGQIYDETLEKHNADVQKAAEVVPEQEDVVEQVVEVDGSEDKEEVIEIEDDE